MTPAAPVNGDVISDGQMAVYSCAEGFTMQGTSTKNCGKEGAGWNSTAPTCSEYNHKLSDDIII